MDNDKLVILQLFLFTYYMVTIENKHADLIVWLCSAFSLSNWEHFISDSSFSLSHSIRLAFNLLSFSITLKAQKNIYWYQSEAIEEKFQTSQTL